MKIFADGSGNLICVLRREAPWPEPAAFAEMVEFDEETNGHIVQAIDSSWQNSRLSGGVFSHTGVVMAVNPPGPVWLDRLDEADAKTSFRSLPNWATYTSAQAESAIKDAIFNGQTQAQVESAITSAITAAPNTIAGVKTVMNSLFIQAATQIIATRDILVVMAKMLVWLRTIVIRRA